MKLNDLTLKKRKVFSMTKYIAFTIFILFILTVAVRVLIFKKKGIKAIFVNPKEIVLFPFVLFYFYVVLSATFNLSEVGFELYESEMISWIGVILCLLAYLMFLFSMISFGKSFRVGIDKENPDKLVTSGMFSISRNPLYTAFILLFLGVFLVMPNWILLLYVFAGFWRINQQVLQEEAALTEIYGQEYLDYCKKVRRYL